MKIPRRVWLGTTATVGLACHPAKKQPVTVEFVGQDPTRGHKLRSGSLLGSTPSETRDVDVLIVGGGVAGMSAAWRLARAGINDAVLIELESDHGGTARGGNLPASPYPMGAHYLPAPHPECRALETLLDDLGLVVDRDRDGRPQYAPSAICSAPTERHMRGGIWYPGLYPAAGQSSDERDQWERWQDHLRALDERRDGDGRRMFRIPVARSSPALRTLDRI